MTARAVMVQGTGSSVGKSLMATALCRMSRQDGYEVAPFKAQNMSLNFFVTPGGGAGAGGGGAANGGHEPVLLKPEVDYRSQLIVHRWVAGKLESLERLRDYYEVVVIEGAGSPAEINLRAATS